MKTLTYLGTLICLSIIALAGISQSSDGAPVVSLIIDPDLPESFSNEQLDETNSNLVKLINVLAPEPRNYSYTLALVQDVSLADRLFLAQLGFGPGVELAISGKNSNEMLSTKTYDDQKAILERSKEIVEAAKICGENVITVRGFMPQSFDQNEDTYKALDELGILYNMGFQAGIISAPGHENDVWPYKVENHDFYAVPVSTAEISGERVPLDDRYLKDKGISASQYYDLLAGKLDEISGKDEPMVVSLSSSVSGKGDNLEEFKRFIDYADSKGAQFVKTYELIEMKFPGTIEEAESECKTCDQAKDLTAVDNQTTNMTFVV